VKKRKDWKQRRDHQLSDCSPRASQMPSLRELVISEGAVSGSLAIVISVESNGTSRACSSSLLTVTGQLFAQARHLSRHIIGYDVYHDDRNPRRPAQLGVCDDDCVPMANLRANQPRSQGPTFGANAAEHRSIRHEITGRRCHKIDSHWPSSTGIAMRNAHCDIPIIRRVLCGICRDPQCRSWEVSNISRGPV